MSELTQRATSTYTPEYRAFQQCYETLILTVKLQPGAFCDSLFAKGYIPEAVRDYTRNESNMEEKKAERLVDSVIDQIKHDPSVFFGFIDILKIALFANLLTSYSGIVMIIILKVNGDEKPMPEINQAKCLLPHKASDSIVREGNGIFV